MRIRAALLLCALLGALIPVCAWASPATGDRGIGTWIVLLIVALIVLIGVIILLIRKNKGDR